MHQFDIADSQMNTQELNRRTIRKLDFVLLPFLALLFLFNSLDRSNIGNAETADFTKDVGLDPQDLNTAVAVFFAFFVALQPVGTAIGRKIGITRFIPTVMVVWGILTALHVWVRTKWELIGLRMVIGILEAGFYPLSVSYISLFYTQYELGRRLAVFYGQYAVAGALGGLLSYAVFARFPRESDGWKSWQILFLLEGGSTVVIALIGFVWLPRNAKTAWFLKPDERIWAEERIRRDRETTLPPKNNTSRQHRATDEEDELQASASDETHGLLHNTDAAASSSEPGESTGARAVTDDRGLSKADVLEAVFDWKLWYLLLCNILSSIPVTAFSVFLPVVLKPLAASPAHANLLTVPPFLFGAVVLYAFTHWSDKSRQRIVPILWGLGLLLAGLTGVVVVPSTWAALRYTFLCVLLSGTFVASPLTIALFAGNTPEPGKRSVILGINGWGNLAGVFSSLLYRPSFGPSYKIPFFVTLMLVLMSFWGYAFFRVLLLRENHARQALLESWSESEVEAERRFGRGPAPDRAPGNKMADAICAWAVGSARRITGVRVARWLESLLARPVTERRGDERLTFKYGL